MELGDDSRYVVKGEGTITFQLESGGSLDSHDVLYIPGLKKNLFSISAMEDRGFAVTFHRGQVLIRPKKASSKSAMVVGVKVKMGLGLLGPIERVLWCQKEIYNPWSIPSPHSFS